MADKKRKSVGSASGPPAKKNKKSVPSESVSVAASEPAGTTVSTNEPVTQSKSSRKRASDFLDDTASLPADLSVVEKRLDKKSKHRSTPLSTVPSKTEPQAVLNGVKTDSADTPDGKSGSNGLRQPAVADEDQNEHVSDEEDQGAALLAGFDSDSDDPAEDQGDLSKPQPIPNYKKTTKKLKQAKEKGSDGPGAVYVGRIPHGFYEHQMRDYFSQFGNITKLRISRNKRTGASKHFAFIEFESDEVAKIVAETMDNYLMFGHILKCKYAPSDSLHPDVWKGANKKFRRIPHDKLERQQLEAPKTQEQWTRKNEKEQKKRLKQAEKMKAIGYEYVVPQLTSPANVAEQKKLAQSQTASQVAAGDNVDAIEAPPSVPAAETVMKQKAQPNGGSKPRSTDDMLTEGNLDARNAGPAAESAKLAQNKADKENHITTQKSRRRPSKGSNFSKPKMATKESGGSVITDSSRNEYDGLSSIPVGIEAAPDSVTDANTLPDPDEYGSIFTHAGVADTVLKGRHKDRKRERAAKKVVKDSTEKTVSNLAPGAAGRDKANKARDQTKQIKGILKKGKM